MFVLLLMILPLVFTNDLIDFDPGPATPLSEELHSDFGEFIQSRDKNFWYSERRPRFRTQTYNQTTTQKPINDLLKTFLTNLHERRYGSILSNQSYVDTESKFIDGTLGDFKNKTKQFFSLFTVVKFPNGPCQSSLDTGNYTGTCYHSSECAAFNGTAMGTCANGYGVCCVFRSSCGASSGRNCTYFESPGYPNYDPTGSMVVPPGLVPPSPTMNPSPTPDPRLEYQQYLYGRRHRWVRQTGSGTNFACIFSVEKSSASIQQIRIDFDDLELAGPTNGTCMDERLVISGQNLNDVVPVICGYNTGQHVYVDVSMLNGPLQISVLSNTGNPKRYKLRVCQYEAVNQNSNCLQYYIGTMGVISSFNYDQAVVNRSFPGYFNNLNYAICIRKEAGYCSITYSNNPPGVEYPFQLVNQDDTGNPTVPPGQAGADIFNCPDDYIVIGGIRLCGNRFNDGTFIEDFTRNAPVTDSNSGPIVIPIRTNQAVTGRGFKLFYTQNACNNFM